MNWKEYWPFVLAGLLGFAVLGWLVRDWLRIRSLLNAAASMLMSERPQAANKTRNPFVAEVLSLQIGEGLLPQAAKKILGGRITTLRSVESCFDETLEIELERAQGFTAAPLITGIGLCLTFVVIALLLSQLALAADATATANFDLLIGNVQRTISSIGTKFYVSAATVGMGAFHLFTASVFRSSLRGLAREVARTLSSKYVGSEQLSAALAMTNLRTQQDQLEVLEGVKGELTALSGASRKTLSEAHSALVSLLTSHGDLLDGLVREAKDGNLLFTQYQRAFDTTSAGLLAQGRAGQALVAGRLESIETAVHSLQSIKVTVENLGTEVAHSLQGMLKDTFGEELKVLVAEQKAHLEAIVDKISTTVSAELANSLQQVIAAMGDELRSGLEKVRAAIEAQSSGNLGELLGRLEAVASEQVKDDSRQLKEILDNLGLVLPNLERSLAMLASRADEQLAQQAKMQADFRQEFLEQSRVVIGDLQSSAAGELARVAETMSGLSTSLEAIVRRQVEGMEASDAQLRNAARGREVELANALQAFGRSTNQVIATSLESMQADMQQLGEQVLTDAARGQQQLIQVQDSVDKIARSLTTIAKGISDSMIAAAKLTENSRPMLEGTQKVLDATGRALNSLQVATTDSAKISVELRGIATANGESTKQVAASLSKQAELSQALQHIYPKLLDEFTQKAASVAKETTKTASEVVQSAQKLHERESTSLKQSIAELREVVEDFVESQKRPAPERR